MKTEKVNTLKIELKIKYDNSVSTRDESDSIRFGRWSTDSYQNCICVVVLFEIVVK